MAFDFMQLPKRAQRAAFAHMSKTGKATSAVKTAAAGGARRKIAAAKPSTAISPVLNPTPNGGFQSAGRISREDAAAIMFGSRGAAARIAKANAKSRRRK